MTRSQELDFSTCQIRCWPAKSFNTLIVKSFILFQYSSEAINCYKTPAVYLALKHIKCFCLSIPHDCLVVIALKNDLSEEGRAMITWQFTSSIKDFSCARWTWRAIIESCYTSENKNGMLSIIFCCSFVSGSTCIL